MTRRIWGGVLALVLAGSVQTSAQELDATKLVFTSTATITSGTDAPTASEPNGSWYLRTNGQWYYRLGGAWVALVDTAGKIPALSSTYFSSLSAANLTSLPAGQLTGTITSATQDLITRTGTVTSGTWSASFGAVSGANLTTLTAANLTGTITSAVQDNITRLGAVTTGSFPAANLSGTTLAAGVVTSSLTTVGALNAGSITSGFGAIDVGADAISGGALSGTTLTLSSTIGSSLIPTTTDAHDLGRYDKLWDEAFISVMNAVVFKESTQTIFGGYSTIAKQAGSFAADVSAAATSINFGQAMTPNDWVLVRAHDTGGTVKAEYVQVLTLVSGTTYNVTRDLAGAHGTDPAWASGTPFLVLGADGDGRIDMLAYDGSPRIVFTEQGATYNTQNDRAVIGNLNGYYGYAAPTFGFAAGAAAAANITIDATNGLRIRHGTTDKITLSAAGDASFSGAVTSTSGTIGGWTLGANSLTGGNATLASSGNLTLGTADDVLRASADDATYRLWIGDATAADAPFRVDKDGAATLTSASITGGAVTLDTTGLYISPSSASGGGAYANANAVRWTTDTTYRTAIWRTDDTSASAIKTWNHEAIFAGASTVIGQSTYVTRGHLASPTAAYGQAFMEHRTNSGNSYGGVLVGAESYDGTSSTVSAGLVAEATYPSSRGVLVGVFSGAFNRSTASSYGASTLAAGLNISPTEVGVTGTVKTSGAVYERGRTAAAMGEWIAVAHSAGNFTASSGTWTVDSGDQLAFAYTLVGKTITVVFTIVATDVSATPTDLLISIPGGFTAARRTDTVVFVNDASAGQVAGQAYVTVGGSAISVRPLAGGAWTATSSDNTTVAGKITFEIQ